MSVALSARAWALDLPAGPKLVLLALADWANDDGEAYPGTASLERKTSLSRSTVIRARAALRERGLLDWDDDERHPRVGTLVYRLTLPCQSETRTAGGGVSVIPGGCQRDTRGGVSVTPNTKGDTSDTRKLEPPPSASPRSTEREIALRVLDAWRASSPALARRRATDARVAKILARLREGASEEELIAAVTDGWRADPWIERAQHNDVTVLLRSPEQFEKFRDLALDGPPVRPDRATAEMLNTHNVMARWAAMGDAHDQAGVDGRGRPDQPQLPGPAARTGDRLGLVRRRA